MSIKMLRELLDPIEELVFANEVDFCKTFCKITDVMDLTGLRVSSGTVQFTYVGMSGQHFVDGISWEDFSVWVKEIEMKETIKTFITEYIRIKQLQDEHTDKLFDAVSTISGGACDYDPMVYQYYRFIEDTIAEIIGKSNAEWIDWFLYDSKYMAPSERIVTIDGNEFNITTTEDLVEHCIVTKECNKAFFKKALK